MPRDSRTRSARNDPVERLPMKPGGVKNLIGHKWFETFAAWRWNQVRR